MTDEEQNQGTEPRSDRDDPTSQAEALHDRLHGDNDRGGDALPPRSPALPRALEWPFVPGPDLGGYIREHAHPHRLLGMDLGRPGGDLSVAALGHRNADGSIEIEAVEIRPEHREPLVPMDENRARDGELGHGTDEPLAVKVLTVDGKRVFVLTFAHTIVELWPDCVVTRTRDGRSIPAAPNGGETWADTAWHEIAHTLVAELLDDRPSVCLGARSWNDERHREETIAFALGRHARRIADAIRRAYPEEET